MRVESIQEDTASIANLHNRNGNSWWAITGHPAPVATATREQHLLPTRYYNSPKNCGQDAKQDQKHPLRRSKHELHGPLSASPTEAAHAI